MKRTLKEKIVSNVKKSPRRGVYKERIVVHYEKHVKLYKPNTVVCIKPVRIGDRLENRKVKSHSKQ